MLDLITRARQLDRPGLLVRAARYQLDHYRRETALRRLLDRDAAPRSGEAMMELLEIEAMLDLYRCEKATHYDFLRHIAVLTAIMGEARLLMATKPVVAT